MALSGIDANMLVWKMGKSYGVGDGTVAGFL